MKGVSDILIVLAVTVCLHSQLGFSMRMTVDPSEVNKLVYRDVLIKCSFDEKEDSDAKAFRSMEVERNQKTMVALNHKGQVTVGPEYQDKVKAVGEISETFSQNSLQVTVLRASTNNAGDYVCRGYYTNMAGTLKETEAKVTITVTEPNTEDAIKYLVGRVYDLESQVEQQEKALKELSDKENTDVFFLATHNRTQSFEKGTDLVFETVVANTGDGYNPANGVFKAPADGYYLFRLSLFVAPFSEMYVNLQTSSGDVLTKMAVGIKGGTRDYSDTSCVVKLKVGEEVKPSIRWVTDSFFMQSYGSSGRFNTYSGYLLKAL